MTDEQFERLFLKIGAIRLANQSFISVLVDQLEDAGAIDRQALLERLHLVQETLPGVNNENNQIALDVLDALGGIIGAVEG
jgi:hypothetical protein